MTRKEFEAMEDTLAAGMHNRLMAEIVDEEETRLGRFRCVGTVTGRNPCTAIAVESDARNRKVQADLALLCEHRVLDNLGLAVFYVNHPFSADLLACASTNS